MAVSARTTSIGMLRLLIDRDSLKKIGRPIKLMELMTGPGGGSAIPILGSFPKDMSLLVFLSQWEVDRGGGNHIPWCFGTPSCVVVLGPTFRKVPDREMNRAESCCDYFPRVTVFIMKLQNLRCPAILGLGLWSESITTS